MKDYFKAGHFYSPIVSYEDIKKREHNLWGRRTIPILHGVNLNVEQQLKLAKEFALYYAEIPFEDRKQGHLRYYFENEFYSYMDAIILYSVMQHFQPRNIIEVGSGFSSAVMLDVRQLFFLEPLGLTFIDPNPETLYSLMTEKDKKETTVITDIVQNVDVKLFEQLQARDILFIDSSHVLKIGSDLAYLLFEVLYKLKRGVLIHFHDIFFPFEYPTEWVHQGRHWNEAYALRAFLTNNNAFEIQFFSDYLFMHHREVFDDMPLCCKNSGGNIWIQKL